MSKMIPVKDWPGYFVSAEGEVFSDKKGSLRKLKTVKSSRRYAQVTLSRPGKLKSHNVHKLVMDAFIGPRPENYQVAHLDGNRMNPKLANLRYVTVKENHSHRRAHGTSNAGSTHGLSKLTEKDVLGIRAEFVRKNSKRSNVKALAAKYKTCASNIKLIVARKAWTHI